MLPTPLDVRSCAAVACFTLAHRFMTSCAVLEHAWAPPHPSRLRPGPDRLHTWFTFAVCCTTLAVCRNRGRVPRSMKAAAQRARAGRGASFKGAASRLTSARLSRRVTAPIPPCSRPSSCLVHCLCVLHDARRLSQPMACAKEHVGGCAACAGKARCLVQTRSF